MGTPITVTLKNQSTAWKEIQNAINKTLSNDSKGLNKQTRMDLQTQATATAEAASLQVVSDQLNGPVSGYQIPTEFELYAPLRSVMQQTSNFPCANNPFDNEPYIASDNTGLNSSGSPMSSPPIDTQFNYVLQRLMYLSLHGPFVNDLQGYQNYTDLYLEDEALSDLEKKVVTDINSYLTVTDMLQWLTTAWNAQQATPSSPPASPPASPPSSLLILPPISSALYQQVRTWLGVLNNATKINDIVGQYITNLTGPDSTVFPPPAGKTFLENLSALLYGNIKSQMSPALQKLTNIQVPTDSDMSIILATTDANDKTTLVNSLPVIQNGIDITIFEQLVGIGIQGMLLADIYDYEKSLDFQQSVTYMLNSLPQYTTFTSDANTDASTMAQAILTVKADINSYYSQWSLAKVTIDENAAISGSSSGQNINSQLSNDFNGVGTPQMLQYLTYIIEPTGGSAGLIDLAEDYSTNIAVQLAGLNYIAQTTMVPTATLNNVNTFVTTINTQVQSDITQLQSLFQSYVTATTNWITSEENFESNNDVVEAQMGVSRDVTNIMNTNNQPKAN